jgi:pimeloyl-ACP methyl ester carboxylesterase
MARILRPRGGKSALLMVAIVMALLGVHPRVALADDQKTMLFLPLVSADAPTAERAMPALSPASTPSGFAITQQGKLVVRVLLLSGTFYQMMATEIDKRSYVPPGEMVDVGGYQLYLYCVGENRADSPTVMLEHGLGGTSAAWAWLQPEIAKTTRVCAYDRAGMGLSDPGPAPRDAQSIARELHSLLQAAGEPAPYVLVGWSFGGLLARVYAGQYPEEVGGLVLLDSSHPDQWTSTVEGHMQYQSNALIYTVAPWLARLGVLRLMGLFQHDSGLPSPQSQALKASFAATKDWDTQSAEFLAWPLTNAQVHDVETLGDLPLFVLTATAHGTPPEQEQMWQSWQNELALLSTNSVHQVLPGVDHTALWRNPETAQASIAAILQIVQAAAIYASPSSAACITPPSSASCS